MKEIMVYFYDLEEVEWSEEDEQKLRSLPESEQTHIRRYRFPVDRRLSLYSRYYLRKHLEELLGIPATQLVFERESGGKPYVKNHRDLCFNLSHTRGRILIGISSEQPIGVDVERIMIPPYEIMDRCFSTDEKSLIASMSGQREKRNTFYWLWTRKEAYGKMMGDGLRMDLKLIPPAQNGEKCTLFTETDDLYMETVAVAAAGVHIHIIPGIFKKGEELR